MYFNASTKVQKEKEMLIDWDQIFPSGYYQIIARFYDDIDGKIHEQTSVHIYRKS
jgi:hypothetical protein